MKLAASILALCLLIPVTTFSQYLESVIQLPDTLGPLLGPYHLAWDSDPAHPRLYIGGEADSGGVIVVDARSFARLARIQTGPVHGMCYCPTRNRLYVSRPERETVLVVDCALGRVVATVPVGHWPRNLLYNPVNERVYCANTLDTTVSVIDCSADTLLSTVAVGGSPTLLAFDSLMNKVYVACTRGLAAIDCRGDSVVAFMPDIKAEALCVNPDDCKLYAARTDTVLTLETRVDTVSARQYLIGYDPFLAYDRVAMRLCVVSTITGYSYVTILNADGDSIAARMAFAPAMTGVVCDPTRGKVYCMKTHLSSRLIVLDVWTGQTLGSERYYPELPRIVADPVLGRLYCFGDRGAIAAVDFSDDSVAGVVPLSCRVAYDQCLAENTGKLYGSFCDGGGYVGIVDCARKAATSVVPVAGLTGPMCHSEASNRLYVGGRVCVTVMDCRVDSVVRRIPTAGVVQQMHLHPTQNKLYCKVDNESADIQVIDCGLDSLTRTIDVPGILGEMCLVPESDRLFCFWEQGGFTVIDCRADTVLADTTTGWSFTWPPCHSPEDRKLYVPNGWMLHIVDIEDWTQVESLPRPTSAGWGTMHSLYASRPRKLYWSAADPLQLSPDSFYVVDTQGDSVVARFAAGHEVSGMSMGATGDYLYVTSMMDSHVVVVDTRTDSAVRHVPGWYGACFSPVLSCSTGDVYIGNLGVILVFRDSASPGVADQSSISACSARQRGPSLMNRRARLNCAEVTELYDASGRQVAVLPPGLGDIGRLSPGVYFARTMCDSRTSKILVVK